MWPESTRQTAISISTKHLPQPAQASRTKSPTGAASYRARRLAASGGRGWSVGAPLDELQDHAVRIPNVEADRAVKRAAGLADRDRPARNYGRSSPHQAFMH